MAEEVFVVDMRAVQPEMSGRAQSQERKKTKHGQQTELGHLMRREWRTREEEKRESKEKSR